MARILHIINALTPGGAEQTVQRLARHSAAHGHTVCVLALARRGALAEELAADNIPVTCAGFSHWWQFRRLLAVARALRTFHPDLVHAHLFAAELTAVAAARLAGWRGRLIISKYENGYWMGRRHRLAERVLIVPRGDALVCDSATLPPLLAGRGFSANKCTVIYPLVAGEFETIPAAPEAGEFRLLLPARLDPVKGHDTLLAATAQLRATLPNLKVFCIGDGPQRAALQEQAAAAGIASAVTFTGTRRDLPAQMGAAAVVVLPSRAETTPLVLLEAMAAGRAIVATALPGIREILVDGHEALLVPPGDAGALAAALQRLHDQPELRRALGAAARDRYRRDFSAAAQLQKMDLVYGHG